MTTPSNISDFATEMRERTQAALKPIHQEIGKKAKKEAEKLFKDWKGQILREADSGEYKCSFEFEEPTDGKMTEAIVKNIQALLKEAGFEVLIEPPDNHLRRGHLITVRW